MTYALEDYSQWNLPWRVADGHLGDLRRGNFFVLDESAARRYGAFSSGEYREVIGRRLKIIGRTREAISFTTTPIAFLDFHLARRLDPQGLANKTTYVLVKLTPGANTEAVRAEIRRRLPYNDVHTKAEWAARSRRYWIESTGLGLNMYTTVFLGCLVGVVVVAQTLYTSTMEHFKEFATLKAIGGGNRDIYRILIKQALVAALLGFGIGAGLGEAIKPAMAQMELKLIMPPEWLGVILGGTVLLCLVAALVSFRKIASLEPAMVFRT